MLAPHALLPPRNAASPCRTLRLRLPLSPLRPAAAPLRSAPLHQMPPSPRVRASPSSRKLLAHLLPRRTPPSSTHTPADLIARIEYSEKYNDSTYEYRHVILPKPLAKSIPQQKLLSESGWRGIGVQQVRACACFVVALAAARRERTTAIAAASLAPRTVSPPPHSLSLPLSLPRAAVARCRRHNAEPRLGALRNPPTRAAHPALPSPARHGRAHRPDQPHRRPRRKGGIPARVWHHSIRERGGERGQVMLAIARVRSRAPALICCRAVAAAYLDDLRLHRVVRNPIKN